MHSSKKVFGCPERLFTLFTSFYAPLLRRSQLDFENPFPLIVVLPFYCIMSVWRYLSCDFKSVCLCEKHSLWNHCGHYGGNTTAFDEKVCSLFNYRTGYAFNRVLVSENRNSCCGCIPRRAPYSNHSTFKKRYIIFQLEGVL